jgi:pimeloyl-ACP methyl ester carboxylesterase
MVPKSFVLVHGAWHGGWCWRRVADILTQRGHRVFAPTLTGLGARSHLMSRDIRLATHVADVVNVIKYERLTDVVLCGHSYGGFVISGAAEEIRNAIASIVFLDAFYPDDGQALVDKARPQIKEMVAKVVSSGGNGIPAPSAAMFGVNERDRAWVDGLMGPQPVATFTDKIALTGARELIARKTYIRAVNYNNPAFDQALARLKTDKSWRTYELPCGHDIMVDMPERLAEILLDVA